MSAESKTTSSIMKPKVPKHLGVIPDGNRRYAREKGISRKEAHVRGADKIEDLLDWCLDLGIQHISVYAFSTENFKRPDDEKKNLMKIFSNKFKKIANDEKIHKNEVEVRTLGRTEYFPENVKKAIKEAEDATSDYDRYNLNIAIGYSGREEIADAAREISKKISRNEISPEDIDRRLISSECYAPNLPNLDLTIRTSGEKRLSSFLLWHISESKLAFSEKYWPEFEKEDLLEAVKEWRNSGEKSTFS